MTWQVSVNPLIFFMFNETVKKDVKQAVGMIVRVKRQSAVVPMNTM